MIKTDFQIPKYRKSNHKANDDSYKLQASKIKTIKSLLFITFSLAFLGYLALNAYQNQDKPDLIKFCPDLKSPTSTAVKCITESNETLFLKSRSSKNLQVANELANFIGLSVMNGVDVTTRVSPDLQKLFQGTPILATKACKLKFLDNYDEAYSYYPKVLFLGLGVQHAGNIQRNCVTKEIMFIDLDASAITDSFSLIRPFLEGRDPQYDLFYDYIPRRGDVIKMVLECVSLSQNNIQTIGKIINDTHLFELFEQKLELLRDVLTRYPQEAPSTLWTLSKEFSDFESLLPEKIKKLEILHEF